VLGSLTLVYDRHARELAERMGEIQHERHGLVVSALHVHLSHDDCMAVIASWSREQAAAVSVNMSAKLMVVAMIFTTANPHSGYYDLRRPGVFAHSFERAYDVLIRDFGSLLSLGLSGAKHDVIDREDARQLSVTADDRKPPYLLAPHGFERRVYILVQRTGVNIA
jgi:hypothetical protein